MGKMKNPLFFEFKSQTTKILLLLALFSLAFYSVKMIASPSFNSDEITDQNKVDTESKIRSILNRLEKDTQIKVKIDPQGQIWFFEHQISRSFLLRKLNAEPNFSFEIMGINPLIHSFDFAFDPFYKLWLVWIESDNLDKLWLKAFNFDQPILIDSGPLFTLTSPSISIDLTGTVWIFWAKSFQGLDRIFFTRFHQQKIDRPQALFAEVIYPCIMPCSSLDSSGRLWLAWSAYNGTNYEILVASYNGENWSLPQIISSNFEANFLPRFCQTQDGTLILTWVQPDETGNYIWLAQRKEERWSKPQIIGFSSEQVLDYQIIPSEHFIILVKKGGNYSLLFPENEKGLNGKNQKISYATPKGPLFSFGRNDDAYIAFGDSITSGLIYVNLNPEVYYYSGYPQRLEEKLKLHYGVGRVINEGFDGELTVQGVSRLPQVIDRYDARYLLLMEGFNDVIFPNISLDTVIFNLQTMVIQARQKGVFTFLATVTPRRDSVWYQPFYRQRHLTLNERIRQLASQLKVPLVDQYLAMENYPASDGGLLSLFSIDLKHPNEKGYQFMAETWLKEIQAFPFPPLNLKIIRRDFVWDAKFISLLSWPERQMAAEEGIGNFIFWQINPKIKNPSLIEGYRLYRKRADESDAAYTLLANIKDYLHYLDKNVILNLQYSYLVSTYRTDGVEGPVAGPVTR